MPRAAILLLLVVVTLGPACSKPTRTPPPPTPGLDAGMDAGNGDAGGDVAVDATPDATPMPPPDMPTDMPPFDNDVSNPGYMNGTWILTARGDTTVIATLKLRQLDGETTVTGTFDMTDPSAFGQIVGGKYEMSTFTTSWTINDNGTNRRFGLSDCTELQMVNQLACRFSDSGTATVIDADLTKSTN